MKRSLSGISGTIFLVAIFSFCLTACAQSSEGELPPAEEIIEKYLKATGGRKAREKIRNRKTKYKIDAKTYGREIDFTYYQERPNKAYSLLDMGAMGKMKYGSDGKVAWEISPFTGTRVLEGEELATRLLGYVFDGPDAWKGLYKSVITEGIEDVNERACYKVVFTPKQGPPRIAYYDKETFLVLKTVSKTTNQSGTYNIETFLEDYRKTGKILSAYKITEYAMGQVIYTMVVKSIETNIEMPDGIFDLPEEIQNIIQGKHEDSKVDKPILPDSVDTKTWESSAFQVDLSPAKWDPAEKEKYDQLNQQIERDNTMFEGENGVIVGALSPPAQRAGLEALRQGGSAMDAALTTSLTQIALAAGSYVSYSGVMAMVYYEAETGRYHNLNATWNTPLEEDDPMSIPRKSGLKISAKINPSGRTALVPGYMAGVEAAHKRFGKLPFSALFTPAIYYAEKGFKVPASLAGSIFARQSVLSRLPEAKRVFMNEETGYFYGAGDQFCQPELAATLRAVADQGAAYMYTGEWAKKLVDIVKREGGKMTMEDLKNYKVIWSEPLKITYGDFTIYTPGLPAIGGVNIAQALNVASEAGLSNMGHYSESPLAFFWLFQINNLVEMTSYSKALRSTLLKGIDSSLPSLATKTHAKQLWSMMSKGEFGMTKTPASEPSKHSEAVVAIDKWGNVAAMVHTCNTVVWGETGMFVDGISIPDAATWQQSMMIEIGPGKRLPDTMEPLIISRNGKPAIALASVGSGLHQATNSVLFNIMDFNMGLKEAIDAPSLHLPKYSPSGRIPQAYYGDFSDELLAGVEELGLEVEVIPITGGSPGWVIGAMIDPDGLRKAVPSPRGNGVALGY